MPRPAQGSVWLRRSGESAQGPGIIPDLDSSFPANARRQVPAWALLFGCRHNFDQTPSFGYGLLTPGANTTTRH